MDQVPTRAQMVAYVRRWKQLGPLLEDIRDRDIREANTQESIAMFDQAFRIALRDLPSRDSSGLVEWQRYMRRWRQGG